MLKTLWRIRLNKIPEVLEPVIVRFIGSPSRDFTQDYLELM